MRDERDFDYVPDEPLEPHENQQHRRLWIERGWDRQLRASREATRRVWAWVFGIGASLFGIAAGIRALWPWK